ncbi:MAG: RNA polymerase-binding protein DksA [Bradymonadaceae bacterium]|nr:RNA polymerase-binding protein DksA [Lujinxingiaceae bacterium]
MNLEFSQDTLAEIRQDLERQRAELINRSHLARNELREREREPGDSIDQSTDEQGTSTQLRIKDRERNLLAKINEALQRMDDGEYGYCDICSEPIGVGRLKARPMATMCIDCKEEEEREERRRTAVNPGIFNEFD